MVDRGRCSLGGVLVPPFWPAFLLAFCCCLWFATVCSFCVLFWMAIGLSWSFVWLLLVRVGIWISQRINCKTAAVMLVSSWFETLAKGFYVVAGHCSLESIQKLYEIRATSKHLSITCIASSIQTAISTTTQYDQDNHTYFAPHHDKRPNREPTLWTNTKTNTKLSLLCHCYVNYVTVMSLLLCHCYSLLKRKSRTDSHQTVIVKLSSS